MCHASDFERLSSQDGDKTPNLRRAEDTKDAPDDLSGFHRATGQSFNAGGLSFIHRVPAYGIAIFASLFVSLPWLKGKVVLLAK